MTDYDIFLVMSKRFLANFFKRRLNFKINGLGRGKKALGSWGEKQIEKIGSLGQAIVLMETN